MQRVVRPLRVVLIIDVGIFSGKFLCTVWKTLLLVRCLQQRVSSHVPSCLHLLATLENLTLRHFDLNPQRLVSQNIVLRDSKLVDWVLVKRRQAGQQHRRHERIVVGFVVVIIGRGVGAASPH